MGFMTFKSPCTRRSARLVQNQNIANNVSTMFTGKNKFISQNYIIHDMSHLTHAMLLTDLQFSPAQHCLSLPGICVTKLPVLSNLTKCDILLQLYVVTNYIQMGWELQEIILFVHYKLQNLELKFVMNNRTNHVVMPYYMMLRSGSTNITVKYKHWIETLLLLDTLQ